MNTLPPMEILYDPQEGTSLPLPEDLSELYGRLAFPSHPGRPHIISNFVTTLDGVVSLGIPEKTDGDEISGSNRHDSMVMALLRAACDAVIVGAGSLRKSSQHIWTAEHVYPELASSFKTLRQRLGKQDVPLNVFVTASGNIDPALPVFQSGKVPVLLVTTTRGEQKLRTLRLPDWVQIIAGGSGKLLTSREMLEAVASVLPKNEVYMVEGGPHLIAYFFQDGLMDDLFLTLAPQVAGRGDDLVRFGLSEGKIFSPDRSVWGRLTGLRRGGSHLFLRYAFNSVEEKL